MQTSLPATISKITSMADNCWRLQVDTQEMNPEDLTEMLKEKGKLGWFTFSPATIKEIDLSKLPSIQLEENEKSPATRLRGALWVLHEQQGGKPEDFDSFYKKNLERFIQAVKDKLV